MDKVSLDVNILVDFVEKRKDLDLEALSKYSVFISPLSVHIILYLTKKKAPYLKISKIINPFMIATFDEVILNQALVGPTTDFEDNVQLLSAAEAKADLFLTTDKEFLNMKFFGKTKIVSEVTE